MEGIDPPNELTDKSKPNKESWPKVDVMVPLMLSADKVRYRGMPNWHMRPGHGGDASPLPHGEDNGTNELHPQTTAWLIAT